MRAPDASLGVVLFSTPTRLVRTAVLVPVITGLLAGTGPLQAVAVAAPHRPAATVALPASPALPAASAARPGIVVRADRAVRPLLPLIVPVTQPALPPAPVVVATPEVRHRPGTQVVRTEATRVPAQRTAPRATRSTTRAPLTLPTGDVGRVIAFAYAQLGKPYIFAAAGPRGFDCSGLTMAAYSTIGVHLPHLASAQAGYGRRVSLSELQPGDLLIFYGGGHVGLYIGGGKMIAASKAGRPIAIQTVSDRPDQARRMVG